MAIDKKSYSKTKHTGIKVHNDGIKFWFDFTINSKRYSKLWNANLNHTKADRLRTAYNELERIKEEIRHSQGIKANIDATINNYFDIIKDKWKGNTLKKYVLYYEKYMQDTIGKLKIKSVKPSHFTNFNKTIAHLAPSTRKRAYEILQPLFKLAVEDEIIQVTPIKSSHVPKRNQLAEKKVITDATAKYKRVYQAINELFADNPHHRAIFLLGFNGRRLNEVLSLEWDDVNLEDNTYRVKAKNSKVKTDMRFSLPKDAAQALQQLPQEQGRVFNINEVCHYYLKIRELTGIEEFTFHWMRNLAVSALSAEGVDLTHLTAMLGHTDSSTLKKYLSLQREASTKITNDLSTQLLNNQ